MFQPHCLSPLSGMMTRTVCLLSQSHQSLRFYSLFSSLFCLMFKLGNFYFFNFSYVLFILLFSHPLGFLFQLYLTALNFQLFLPVFPSWDFGVCFPSISSITKCSLKHFHDGYVKIPVKSFLHLRYLCRYPLSFLTQVEIFPVLCNDM